MADATHKLAASFMVQTALLACCCGGVALANNADLASRAATHWAFQPLVRPTGVAASGSGANLSATIDQLIASARQAAGATPVEKADRRTLVRRIYFHLTGLPPTPDEVNAFISQESPTATADLVDDLLARPEFGERWGRHWLDVVRYADSNGCGIEANNTFDNAWRYRDYVISAFNNDKRFDRFVIEQIAGDLLEAAADYQRCEQIIATGFLILGPKAFGTGNFEKVRLDAIDDQIDTVGKAFLGLSLGCARCHDHKLEPVTSEDYYALAGIFGSTTSVLKQDGWRCRLTWNRTPLPILDAETDALLRQQHARQLELANSGELSKQADAELEAAKAELAKLTENQETSDEQLAAARQRVDKAELAVRNAGRMAKVLPVVAPVPVAMAVADAAEPHDEAIRLGGDPELPATTPPRAVLPLPVPEGREHYAIAATESGRLQLAHWLVDVERGAGRLVARVIANRIWKHLMGAPLAPSVDNLGLTGGRPTHPELLDSLAVSLVDDDWSMKQLIRAIILSDAYQLASGDHPAAQALDPENKLYWRHTPRRLEVEALRDALLAISGKLDRSRGGKTLQRLGLVSISSDMIDLDAPSPYVRRSVYLPQIRDSLGASPEENAVNVMRAAFDGASPNLVCGARTTSTVPAQALFLMNNEFLAEQARATAEQLAKVNPHDSDRNRVDRLFELALARPARDDEADAALQLVAALRREAEQSEATRAEPEITAWSGLCQAVFACNEFLFLR